MSDIILNLGQGIPAPVCFAINKDTDQLVNPHSLIMVFVVRSQELNVITVKNVKERTL